MDDFVENLRLRYKNVHPLIFQRSVERSKSKVDLFDILEGIPDSYPLHWSEKDHKWVTDSPFKVPEQYFAQ
jgi:hypothetical protein